MRIRKALIVGALTILIAGCDTSPVADDVGQREANQIVTILREHGIEGVTEKGRGARGRYSVKVPSSRFGESVSLLSKLGLPAERKATFAEMVAPSGLLPSSQDVEDLRLDRAIASEVEDLLEGHAGVSSASVVVRSHSSSNKEHSSVSVVIQRESGSTLSETSLRQMVERAVPGVNTEHILLAVADAPKITGAAAGGSGLVPFLMFWNVPADQYSGLATLFGALLIIVAALAGIGGYIYGQFSVARVGDAGISIPSVLNEFRDTDAGDSSDDGGGSEESA